MALNTLLPIDFCLCVFPTVCFMYFGDISNIFKTQYEFHCILGNYCFLLLCVCLLCLIFFVVFLFTYADNGKKII